MITPAEPPSSGAVAAAIEEAATDSGRPDADGAATAQPFHQHDGRELQELHRRWHRGEHADAQVAGTERDRETGQEHAGRQRAHRLTGDGVIQQKAEGPLDLARAGFGRPRDGGRRVRTTHEGFLG